MDQKTTDLAIRMRLAFKLTEKLAELLAVLVERQVVSNYDIITENITVAPAVGVHRLRKALAKTEVSDIRIEVGASLGYWISPEDKEKVLKLSEPYAIKRSLPEEVTNVR